MCTIEKANNIINHLIKTKSLQNYRTVIIDEVHMMSDPKRGYLLELLMNKLLYMQCTETIDLQLITISATLPNIEDFVKYTNSVKFVGTHRPNDLTEYILVIFLSFIQYSVEINYMIEMENYSLPIQHSLRSISICLPLQIRCLIAVFLSICAIVRRIKINRSSCSCQQRQIVVELWKICFIISILLFLSTLEF